MRIQTVKDLMRLKTNDNAPDNGPRIIGDFGKDAVSLTQHWKLNTQQFAAWATSSSLYSMACIGASLSVAISQGHTLPEQARLTVQSLGMMTAMFATLRQLKDPEAMFILNVLAMETDKFLTERKA